MRSPYPYLRIVWSPVSSCGRLRFAPYPYLHNSHNQGVISSLYLWWSDKNRPDMGRAVSLRRIERAYHDTRIITCPHMRSWYASTIRIRWSDRANDTCLDPPLAVSDVLIQRWYYGGAIIAQEDAVSIPARYKHLHACTWHFVLSVFYTIIIISLLICPLLGHGPFL
jgi:hypothetical protein